MRGLYLHEQVDVVGAGAAAYMEHVLRFDCDAGANRGLRLLGTWEVVGCTGRWPQVVNVWELVGGWDGWAALLTAANVRRRDNVTLERWWDEALASRSGGFDRLLAAPPGWPALDALVADGLRGSLFVHELSTVRPGAAAEYLAAVQAEWVPLAAQHGMRPVGIYEVLYGDTEVVTVWATDLDAHVGMQRAGDPRVTAWRARARDYLTRWREELMVPAPGSPLAAAS